MSLGLSRALAIALIVIVIVSVAILSSESMLLQWGMNSNAVSTTELSLRRELSDLSLLVAQLNAKLESSIASNAPLAAPASLTETPSTDATCTFAQHQQQRNDAAEIKRKLDSLLSRQTGTSETTVCPIAKRCDSNRLVIVRRPEAVADCADDDREWATRFLIAPPSPSLSLLPVGGLQRVNETRLRVVFLLPAGKDVFMDRWFHQMAAAAMRNERIDASMWGEGRDGWNASLSAAANLLARYDGPVDVVHMWWRHTLGGSSPIAAGACRVLSTTYHEIYCANRTIGRCGAHRALDQVNMAFFAYANTVPWALENLRTDQLYIHEPHGAERELFEHPVEAERDIDVLLAGRVEYFYPLRTKFYDIAVAGRGEPTITVRAHPSYAMANASAAEEQAADYAAQLKRAKIVLVCRSSRNFALRKYVEAAMAGALVVGDVPDERMAEFRSWLSQRRRCPCELRIISYSTCNPIQSR
jgi:hypothetical protein